MLSLNPTISPISYYHKLIVIEVIKFLNLLEKLRQVVEKSLDLQDFLSMFERSHDNTLICIVSELDDKYLVFKVNFVDKKLVEFHLLDKGVEVKLSSLDDIIEIYDGLLASGEEAETYL